MESNQPPNYNPPPSNSVPPYITPPPVIGPINPLPLRGRGRGWMVLAIILIVLLGFSMLLNLAIFGKHTKTFVTSKGKPYRIRGRNDSGPRLEEVTLSDNGSTKKILVIPIEGIITGAPLEQGEFSMVTVIREELRRAEEDDSVKAVILRVNSPGGEVLASDEIAKALASFQRTNGIPIVVSMGSLAASGGYYVSAPCDWIVANDLTITGSIGVIMHGMNYRGLLDKIGVRPEVFKSGKYKDMMSGTKSEDEITPEERAMVQHLIDETFAKFKKVVLDGRTAAHEHNKADGKKLSDDWQDYADGRILSGKEALDLGFVDELGDFETAISRAKKLANIQKADVIEYKQMFDFANIFKMFGESNAKSVKVDLGTDVPKLHAGYMYFLSPIFLQ